MSTTPVLSANFSGLTTEINRVFSVMSGKTPVLSGPPGPTGPEGPTGPKAATGPTGATGIGIGTTLKGTWTPSGSYGTNGGTSPDAVTYNGSFYVCLNNGVTSSTPPDQDTTNWLRYIQQGGTGPTGLQGNTGPSGATGIGIGTTLQGRWQNGANYYSRSGVNADAVTYSGAFYVCISNISPSTIPPNQDSDHWLAYVDIGPTGATGTLGIDGVTGPTGSTGPIGIGIGTTLKGTWVAGQAYSTNSGTNPDAVTYSGSLYICIQTVTSSVTPDQDPTNWQLYVRQGETGPSGPPGASGVTGPTGLKGDLGFTGPAGATGLKGDTGMTGPAGSISSVGSDGQLLYNRGGILAATGSMMFRPTGPTGSLGQATGPIGQPTLQLGAYLVPSTDATYDLGATGIQFKDVHFSGSLYNNGVPFSGGGGGVSGLVYRETGPTGPDGQPTGPAPNPTLQMSAYLVPTTNATYDLGATGIQFKDVHFSGSLYNNGVPFSGGGGGVSGLVYRETGPTGPDGQPTGPAPNPTLQMSAYLVPTTNATYDLGATGIQFKDIYFSGSLYNNGVPFSGGGGGITAPTDNFMVAGGDGAGLAYSYDGTTWTPSPNGGTFNDCRAIAWNGSIWVLGTNNIVYSSDGINWTATNQTIMSPCLAVAWNGSIWVAGGDPETGGNAIAYSYDGINWTASPQGLIDTTCNALAWNGLIWVAGGSGTNRLAYSVDGINWTASESANTEFTEGGQCNCVAWNGTIWVAGGANNSSTGVLVYSYDGMNWSPVTLEQTIAMANYNTVAWNGYLWLAGGEGTQMFMIQSSDGISWYQITDKITISICRSITWNGTKWFAAGQASSGAGILASSTDGLLWADVTYAGFSTFSYTIASRRVLPFVGTGGSIPGLYYRASGPTGPTGGQTGPTGPWLQVSANMVPVTDNVFDLGATGLRFRDLYVGGTSIHIGDNATISSTNDGLSLGNQYGTLSLMEASILRLPIINTDLDPNSGSILCVANSADGTKISAGVIYYPVGTANTYILTSSNGGLTTKLGYGPTLVTEIGPIASIAMGPDDGLKQFAVSGSKAPWPGNDFQGGILRSTDSGDTWDTLDTDDPAINRSYTSVTISSDATRLVATHLTSGEGETLVDPGFVYSVNAGDESPSFTKVTEYGPDEENLTPFTAPRFVNISQDGARLIIMDVRTGAGETDVICFNMTSGTPVYLSIITLSSVNVLVSNLTTAGFSVLYTTGAAGNWNHNINSYTWSDASVEPALNITSVLYNEETSTGIIDLQLISTADGLTQAILPTYSTASPVLTDGIYISNDSWATWRFLNNNTRGIQTSSTNTVRAIGITTTNMYLYVYNSDPLTTTLYSADFTYIVVNVKNGTSGLNYLPLGPTGPIGQPTGPTGPALIMDVNLVPTTDATYDLGATGIQFKDIHFSGTIYNNGSEFQGGVSGLTYRATGPTGPQGQPTGPTGPTLQINAHLVPTEDLAYDLGATGLRFRDIHVGGSTIYLGDSVSIKATNEGALSVTNNGGTVNLVTPTGFNGGILSGEGVASNNAGAVYYGEETFYPPFADTPIVVASINSASFINSKLYMPKEHLTASGCRIYSDASGTTYNWIATARTNYPFSFYNATTPITSVSATDSSLVLSVNTNLLLRGGVPPYTDVEMMDDADVFEPIAINMNTGVQTITIEGLNANSTYSIYITATDSSATPVTITSDPQDFTTDYAPLNIGNSTITTSAGDTNETPPGTYSATKITVNTDSQDVTGGSDNYTYRIAYSPSNDSPTFDVNNMVEAPWIDIGSSEVGGNIVVVSLTPNTPYYFIMFVSDSTATELAPVFTASITRTTTSAAAPTVTGTATFNSGNGNIELTGTVTNIGSSPIEASGMCYSTTDPPTIDNIITENEGELPNIIASDNPSPGATYYVRAYATNFDSLTGYSSTSTVVVPAS